MEPNWILIISVIIAAVVLIVFLIWRNQKDKKDLMKKIIEEDDLPKPAEHETEVDTEDDIIK